MINQVQENFRRAEEKLIKLLYCFIALLLFWIEF